MLTATYPSIWLTISVAAILCLTVATTTHAAEPAAVNSSARPADLRCEYLENPINIDVRKPRLSWRMDAAGRGQRQTAYRILVARSAETLGKDEGDLWDTGKVSTDQANQITYGGQTLASRQQCFWKVILWDKDGIPTPWSATATWTAAIFDPTDWTGKWIGHDASTASRWPADLAKAKWVWHSEEKSADGFPPGVRFFRSVLSIPREKKITQARFILTADNAFTLFANGRKVGSANQWKAFSELDLTQDVKAAVAMDGAIVLAIECNNSGTKNSDAGLTGVFRVDFEDGSSLPILIDESWTSARVRGQGWETAAFVPAKEEWTPAKVVGALGIQPWGTIQLPQGPLPIFRREFEAVKQVRRATAYVIGLGHFELSVNGEKVGDNILQPGWTNYRKTSQYVAFDLTDRIKPGRNALGVMLGNGMYNVVGGRYAKFRNSFGTPTLFAQVHFDYADGTSDVIVTDESWKSADGPIQFSCVYGGEDHDARLEQSGWDRPRFDDAGWRAATVVPGPGGALSGSSRSGPPIRVTALLPAKKITEPRPGIFIFDTAQNAAQIPKITFRGRAGAKVRITPCELLTPEGLASQKSSGTPAYYEYTLKGGEAETWMPRFFYYGCRYYQIEGAAPDDRTTADASTPVVLDLTGQFITSSVRPVGSFACSNDLFNRTSKLIDWAVRSNLMSVLTDCPHREKLGWLEQVHLMGPSIMYNYDLATMMTKTSGDMADSQLDSGLVPDIAPEFVAFNGPFRDSPEWGSAAVLVPWQVYEWYGDLEVLRTNYDVMRRYVAYLGGKSKGNLLNHGLGDWYDLGPKPPGNSQLTPVMLTATAFYFHDVHTLAKIATLLGKTDDAEMYRSLAVEIRKAFNEAMYDKTKGSYATSSQCSNAIPLVLGLAPDEERSRVLEALVKDIRDRGNSLTAGDVGYRFVLRALGDAGRSDVIFDMNSRSDRPGYGYMLNKGATALTEAWDARDSSSHNHFMLGHLMEWFYRDLAGIQPDPTAPGFKKFIIKPSFVGDVAWAKSGFASAFGKIECAWKREAGKTSVAVTVPANSTATVFVPTGSPDEVTEGGSVAKESSGVRFMRVDGGHAVFEVQSGRYEFQAR